MKQAVKAIVGLALVLALALALIPPAAAQTAPPPSGLPGQWKLVQGSPGIHLGLTYQFNPDHTGSTTFNAERSIHWKWQLEGGRLTINNPDGSSRSHTLTWMGKHRFKLSGSYGYIVLQRQ